MHLIYFSTKTSNLITKVTALLPDSGFECVKSNASLTEKPVGCSLTLSLIEF